MQNEKRGLFLGIILKISLESCIISLIFHEIRTIVSIVFVERFFSINLDFCAFLPSENIKEHMTLIKSAIIDSVIVFTLSINYLH